MKMFQQIKDTAVRAQPTLLQDAVGAGALLIMLIVGLHFPVFF